MRTLALAFSAIAVTAMMATVPAEAQTSKEPKAKYTRKCKPGQVWNASATLTAGKCEKRVAKAKAKSKAKS